MESHSSMRPDAGLFEGGPTPKGSARIVAITNQKGGVAKTTTIINLGAHLARHGAKVLIIDTDAQGNCATGLGIDKGSLKLGAHTIFFEPEKTPEARVSTVLEGLHLIPADQRLIDLEQRLTGQMGRERRLSAAIATIREEYDIILIDTPPSLGAATISALTAADGVIIPVQTEYFALEGLAMLTQTMREVRKRLNSALGIDAVVLTMHAPTRLNAQVARELRDSFGRFVIEPPIRRNISVAEANAEGLPIQVHAPSSNGGKDYADLAHNLVLRWGLSGRK